MEVRRVRIVVVESSRLGELEIFEISSARGVLMIPKDGETSLILD